MTAFGKPGIALVCGLSGTVLSDQPAASKVRFESGVDDDNECDLSMGRRCEYDLSMDR